MKTFAVSSTTTATTTKQQIFVRVQSFVANLTKGADYRACKKLQNIYLVCASEMLHELIYICTLSYQNELAKLCNQKVATRQTIN